MHPEAFTAENESEPRLEVALRWTESTDELIRSYANGIPTESGGTHENGFKQGLSKAIRNHMDAQKLTPKGVKITAEDIREGLVALVSVYVEEPQFQGQTKDRLNNPEITAQIETSVRTAFEQWLLNNNTSAESIIARVIISARARAASRAASQQVSRKTAISHRLNLPRKARGLFEHQSPMTVSCSSSRGTAPAATRSRGATARRKPSCRFGAKY